MKKALPVLALIFFVSCIDKDHINNQQNKIELKPFPFLVYLPDDFSPFSKFIKQRFQKTQIYYATSINKKKTNPITLIVGFYKLKKSNSQANPLLTESKKLIGLWNIDKKSIEINQNSANNIYLDIKSKEMVSNESFEFFLRMKYSKKRILFLAVMGINPSKNLWNMAKVKSFISSL